MTPEQTGTLKKILDIDLTTVDNDRLVELCVIHLSNPKAHDTFPAKIKDEITRRFTPQEIAKDDVTYAVLERLSLKIQTPVPYLAIKLQEMASTVNRDIWFNDNKDLFKNAINDKDVTDWLVEQRDIVGKILESSIGLDLLAQSTNGATSILSHGESLAQWKNAKKLWDIWPKHKEGMSVLAKSGELVQYVIDTPDAIKNVSNSEIAMAAIANSETAIKVLAASKKGIEELFKSRFAIKAIMASQVAAISMVASNVSMTEVAQSNDVLKEIIKSDVWRKVLIGNNDTFKTHGKKMYETISKSGSGWTKQYSATSYSTNVNTLGGNVTNPAGMVFVSVGYHTSYPDTSTVMYHPDKTVAFQGKGIANPSNLSEINGVSFNGTTFQQEKGYSYLYLEFWVSP